MTKFDFSNTIQIIQTKPAHAKDLEALQYLVFPNLSDAEILKEAHYLRHLEIFPEGQLVALDGEKVIGATTTMRYHFDLEKPTHHTFLETIAGGWLTTHQPLGEWLYGIDVSIHPAYRKMGLAKAIYALRNNIAKKQGCIGQLTVGMLNGFQQYASVLTIDQYYEKVLIGEIFDPTVSVQQKIGFELKGLMKEYLNDPTCGNAGAIIVMKTY